MRNKPPVAKSKIRVIISQIIVGTSGIEPEPRPPNGCNPARHSFLHDDNG